MAKVMTSVRLDIKDQKTRKDFEEIVEGRILEGKGD